MTVSVIVPVYKVEQYIEDCIQSIINQTYRDIQLILVDDKSPDASMALAREVLARNDFHDFTIIEHAKNGGLSAARNTGLAAATGDLILFVDSDDTLEPTMLEELTDVMDQHDVDIVVCNIWRIRAGKLPRELWSSTLTGLVDSDTAVQAILEFREKAYIWTNLYKRTLFDHSRFTENVCYEDIIIQPLLWKEARNLYFHQRPLYNYFERSGSITTKLGNLGPYLGIPDAYKKMEENFSEDAHVSQALRTSLSLYTYTWIRNLSLTITSSSLPYNKVEDVLKKYGNYLNFTTVLRMGTGANLKLAIFLAILKLSPYLYWRRFSTQLLER